MVNSLFALQALYQKAIDRPGDVSEDERQLLIDAYDGEIRYLDDQLRAFFDELDRRGQLKESLVVLTADHGDAFGEHGYYTHPRHLHESLLHVPLLVSPPGRNCGETAPEPVSTLNIVPTILEYANESRDGIPGMPLVDRDGMVERPESSVVFSTATGEDEYEGVRRFAARGRQWKAVLERDIDSGDVLDERVYDLGDDPEEQTVIRSSEADSDGVVDALREFSASRLDAVVGVSRPEEPQEQSQEVDERLEALGYK